MKNKQVFARLKNIDEKLYTVSEKLRSLDLDDADEIDLDEIIDDIDDARDIVFELSQALQTL